jgi:hypothetical protein
VRAGVRRVRLDLPRVRRLEGRPPLVRVTAAGRLPAQPRIDDVGLGLIRSRPDHGLGNRLEIAAPEVILGAVEGFGNVATRRELEDLGLGRRARSGRFGASGGGPERDEVLARAKPVAR